MITIDRLYVINAQNGAAQNLDIVIGNPNSLLLVLGGTNGSSSSFTSVKLNGVDLTQAASPVDGNGDNSIIYFMTNPPVGQYTLSVTKNGTGGYGVSALVINGASMVSQNYVVATHTGTGSPFPTNITPSSANSLLVDSFVGANNNAQPDIGQTLIYLQNDVPSFNSFPAASFKFSSVQTTMTWTNADSNKAHAIIAIPPAQAPSLWYPVVTTRHITDVVNIANADRSVVGVPAVNQFFAYGNFPNTYFQSSFLHTIGRILSPSTSLATLVAETEQATSQIVIDKVFQGQLAATPITVNTLNMDISIPSPDAVLVVTGGSVIATGGAWGGVQLNGNSLTKLVQTGVAGQSAEIWYTPFPSVGVNTLSIQSASGGEIYANAMVILGVDKRSTNITTASATDAASTSTIGALITPDAPNSLVIDVLSTLNATTFPVQDSSQTQVFNATALASSEYVLSTYKIASAQQNMNYNLSVAVNASLAVVSFRPANAASIWFPNIDSRELDDVVTVNGLDSSKNPTFGQYGYKASNFYLNSFLHTVGRILSLSPVVSIPSVPNLLTSNIIIDQVTYGKGTSSATFNHAVNSQDAVLVVCVACGVDGVSVFANGDVQCNGSPLSLLADSGINGNGDETAIFYMANPPVGNNTIFIQHAGGPADMSATAITLLGVNKKQLIPVFNANSVTNTSVSLNLTVNAPGSMIIDCVHESNGVSPTPSSFQTQMTNATTLNGTYFAASYAIATSGVSTISWSYPSSTSIVYSAIVLQPSNAASIWNPNIWERNIFDVVRANGLDTTSSTPIGSFGYKPSVFLRNSFLHTVGRMGIDPTQVVQTQTARQYMNLMGVGM